MRKALGVLSLFVALSCSASGQTAFKPPEVTRAGSAYVQYYAPITDGLFVFDVAVSGKGDIEQIDVLRNPGSLLGAAEDAIRSWEFQPALEHGTPASARLTVAFVYRPADYGGAGAVPPSHFVPVVPRSQKERGSDDVPVGILSFDYPERPVNSVASGSAVLQVSVSSSGAVTDVEFLHEMPGFDNVFRDALKKWRFRPAQLDGTPISAKIVIVFNVEPAAPYNLN